MAETGNSRQAEGPHWEVLRTARLCHPDWDGGTAVTFQTQSKDSCWNVWRDSVFIPLLFPKLLAAQNAAGTGNRRELLILDREVDKGLSPELAACSGRAGSRLAGAYTAPAAEKLWRHYVDLIQKGETPGNLCVVLAVRGAAFHVAPNLLVAAYVLVEARGGLGERGVSHWLEMVDDCLRASAKLEKPGLRAA